ncbi:amidohydrolase [Mesonia sp. HuA40]|uniref:amidohydrolase n=1 Tax=Mesonia sp. HuA40 TaxID=2602761 RepID=UPI0011CB0D98|nr:amidohydrolase [Mesonia sp. HuA40]TXK73359.1 amidohydrolase [Mesonia sp. HuA40]
MEDLHVSFIQTQLFWEDPQKNRTHFEAKLANLASTDLVVLPEMFSTGFSMHPEPLAEPTNGPSLQWMQKMATQYQFALCGSLIVQEKQKYYNRLYFVYPDGQYTHYNKKHLFSLAGEQHKYSPGKALNIITYKGWRICPLICYDLRFPVWSRNQDEAYDLLLYVANWPARRTYAWDQLLKARAIENMSYVVGVNRIGQDANENQYLGHSIICDMLGQALTPEKLEKDISQGVLLSKEALQKVRKKLGFLRDADSFTLY